MESLIPNESVDALLELWDENLVSEDDMYDAWEMNSFKKWVWKNEEAGWVDLKYICEHRGTFSPQVVEFAEFELWEIQRSKKRDKNIDIPREKRLKSLTFA